MSLPATTTINISGGQDDISVCPPLLIHLYKSFAPASKTLSPNLLLPVTTAPSARAAEARRRHLGAVGVPGPLTATSEPSLPSPSSTHAAIPVPEPAPPPSEPVAVVAPNSAGAHVAVARPRAAVPVPGEYFPGIPASVYPDPSSLPSPSSTHTAIPVPEPAPPPSEPVAVVTLNSAGAHVAVPRLRAAVPVPERTPPSPFRLLKTSPFPIFSADCYMFSEGFCPC
ncbi:hypothetical protein GUJ93_ZPchr0009g1362 [Zizania palustris]|uniref:Uncharacterized protein n=1 Tax=Zizania palustris TaxID=103762 RepID=A0A8J5V8K2_ZIZPA|nr:hypothetical protein GUJ93_ZPchr0009g1362 [Zizania palustris]